MSRKNIPDRLVVEVSNELYGEIRRSGWGNPYRFRDDLIQRLMRRTEECEKVCYAAAERASRRGLIDYGVSIRWAWPTQKGEELLAAVRPGQSGPATSVTRP